MKNHIMLGLVLLLALPCGCIKFVHHYSPDYYELACPHAGETHCTIAMKVGGEEYTFESMFYINRYPQLFVRSLDYPRNVDVDGRHARCKTSDFMLEINNLAGKQKWEEGKVYSIGGLNSGKELGAVCYWVAPGKSKLYLTINEGSFSIEPVDAEYAVKIKFDFAATASDGSAVEVRDGVVLSEYRYRPTPNEEIFE